MATALRSIARSLRKNNIQPLNNSRSFLHSHATSFGFKEVREEEKSQMVGNVFTSVSSSYDLMNDVMSGGLHRLWKDRLVSKLNPFPGMKHLDVAGGTDEHHHILGPLEEVVTVQFVAGDGTRAALRSSIRTFDDSFNFKINFRRGALPFSCHLVFCHEEEKDLEKL